MKLRTVIAVILLILLVDQGLKIFIKLHYPVGPVTEVMGWRWFEIYFIENEGMAWGWKLGGGNWGKMFLTLFRLAAVIFGSWYLGKIVKQHYTKGFVICAAMIYAGALGNLLDSMFYGLLFEESTTAHISRLAVGHGYAGFLHGNVVDMLHFPLVRTILPTWIPLVGGQEFEFFSPIFNIADASISIGVLTLLFFQKRFIHRQSSAEEVAVERAG